MTTGESKHAQRLRELGCVPYHELLSGQDMAETEVLASALTGIPLPAHRSRKERRRLLAEGLVPHFVTTGTRVYILDEAFIDWTGPTGIEEILENELQFRSPEAAAREATHRLRRKMI